jgi:inner membrane transporter RhtA
VAASCPYCPLSSATRLPAPALVIAGIGSTQVGGAIAKTLFDDLGPSGTVLLRTGFAAIVLCLLFRPGLRSHSHADLAVAMAFGLSLAAMNLSFYSALERIPLGIAVTIEFVGPLAVAIGGSRRALDGLWVVLAGAGIVLLARGGGDLDPVGIWFALLAGLLWATSILLSQRTGRHFSSASGLAIAMAVGTVLLAPVGIAGAGADLLEPELLAIGFAVAMLSSAIPYTLELNALRQMPARVFGILMSLEPAMAALAGFVILDEGLRLRDAVAIVLVAAASAGASLTSGQGPGPEA